MGLPQAKAWNSFWSGRSDPQDIYPSGERVVRALSRLGDLAGKKVLEVGAGTGRDSLHAVELGASGYCLDYSQAALALIRKVDRERKLHLIRADATMAPFRSGTFHVVFHQGLLEHFRDPGALLAENRRILKKGGVLLVDVPQTFHPYTILKKILITFNLWFAGWETQYTLTGLERLLRRHRFKPLSFVGEWMYPSLAYRSIRQLLKACRIRLPLIPGGIPGLRELRRRVRHRLVDRRWLSFSYISIGVTAEKIADDAGGSPDRPKQSLPVNADREIK